MPDEVDQVMYACTGSEVNDLALRVAEMRTGATGIVITRDAYHGNTASATAISPSLGGATSIGANVRIVDPPDTYRGARQTNWQHASPPRSRGQPTT